MKEKRTRATERAPDWPTDALSEFFSDAEENVRAIAAHHPEVYSLLNNVHAYLADIQKAIPGSAGTLPNVLLVRAHSAYLAACRLALGGQELESRCLSRLCLETAWYALHIGADPAPPTRARAWEDRDTSLEARSRCRNEFSIRSVRETHRSLDEPRERLMGLHYDQLIDFGAHPNAAGTFATISETREEPGGAIEVALLQGNVAVIMHSLHSAVVVALGAARIYGLLRKQLYDETGLGARGSMLERTVAPTFDQFKGQRIQTYRFRR